MTAVRIRIGPVCPAIEFRPIHRRSPTPDGVVLPQWVHVDLVDGEAIAELAPTDGDTPSTWCWVAKEITTEGITRYFALPNTAEQLDYELLVDVNPEDFEPTDTTVAGWVIARDAALAAVTTATTAATTATAQATAAAASAASLAGALPPLVTTAVAAGLLTKVDKSALPLNLSERGVSHLSTAAVNTAAIQAAIIEAEATGRPVVFPWVPAGAFIDINAGLLVATGGIEISGRGLSSRVRQTVFPHPIFEVTGPNVVVERLSLHTVAFDATAYHTVYRGYTTRQGFNAGVLAEADNVIARNLNVEDTFTAVFFFNWDVPGNAERAPLTGCECHDITVKDVVFGLLYGVVAGFSFSGIRGNYRMLTGASTPCHLIYSSTNSPSNANNTDVIGTNCYAFDGEYSFAYQIKSDDGGQFSNFTARSCVGSLHVMSSVGSRYSRIVSVDDLTTAVTSGSIEVEGAGNTDILISDVSITMGANGKAVRFGVGSTDVTIKDAKIVTNHTATQADADDIELIGTNCTADHCSVTNIGAADWASSISIWGGSGNRIIAPRTAGNKNGVRIRASVTNGGVFDYDVTELGYTTGRTLEAGTGTLQPRIGGTARIDASQFLVYDVADRRAVANYTSSGHPWVATSGNWLTTPAGRIYQSSTGATGCVLYVDTGVADCEVACGIKYLNREGLKLRWLNTTNSLVVQLNHVTSLVEFVSQVAGVSTVIGSAAHVPVVGRRYAVAARLYGNSIEVLVDGKSMFTATVPSEAMTAFGTSTKFGIYQAAVYPAGLFDTFTVKSLT